MTDAQGSRNDTLNAYLAQAADDLARSEQTLGDDAEGLLFLGAWHQSYPAILVRDPFLSDSAKVQFLYLMQESSQNPRGAIAMPSLMQTGKILGHSKKTVHRDRTLLRVCRWISQHKRVRDHQGRYCGSINAIHSEPCALSEANRLDASYLQLLQRARSHSDRYIQRSANAALASIDQALQDGLDPLDPPDPMNRRLDAAKALQNGGGSFFDLLMPDGGTIAKQDDPSVGGHTCGQPSDQSKFTLGGRDTRRPGVNFGADSAGHTCGRSPDRTKFTPGEQGISHPGVNFDAKQGGHTCGQPSKRSKFTPGNPGVNFTPGDSNPSVNFTLGHESVDIEEKNNTYPQIAKSTLGPTCSSSSNKTTTTTEDSNSSSAREEKSSGSITGHTVASRYKLNSDESPESSLRWPEDLPENEKALIEQAFASKALTNEQRQNVLDALDRKMQNPNDPAHTPVGYVVALCKRVKSGTFQPVGAPRRKPKPGKPNEDGEPPSKINDLKQRIHGLQSEIRGLEQNLIPYVDAERQTDLIAQSERLRDECKALKQRYQALRETDEPHHAVRA